MNKLVKLSTTFLAMFALVGCGGNSGGNSSGDESLPYTAEESQAKLNQLGQGDGYFVKFKYSSESNGEKEEDSHFYYGEKGSVCWMGGEDDEGIAVKQEGTSYHFYDLENGAYVYQHTVTEEEYGNETLVYGMIYTSWLFYGNAYDGQLSKGADTKVAGRNCYTYTFSYSNLGNLSMFSGVASVKYEIAVDKELGITMKLNISGQANEESGAFSYEVTEFKTGSAVNVPTLPAATPTAE